jgi:hypothetical protein
MSNFGGKQYLVSAVIIPNLTCVVYCHTSRVLCDISHKLSDTPRFHNRLFSLMASLNASDAFLL